MRLIPKTIVQAVIENAKKKGKVKEVKPTPPEQGQPEPEEPKTKNFDFLKSMSEAKKALGDVKYYEILTGQYSHLHANLVTDEKEQKEIYEEMLKAYKEKAKGKGK